MKFLARLLPVLALMPAVALAQFGSINNFFSNVVQFINNVLVPLVFAIAFLFFIWGVFKYFIMGGGDEGKREEGKQLMIYSIAGFVLMVSVWGIVNVISDGLGFDDEQIRTIPDVPMNNR